MMRSLNVFFILLVIISAHCFAQPPSADKMAQARLHFNNGIKNGIAEDFESAIRDFNQAIALNPFSAEAFLYKGLAEIEMKNYDQAVKDFTITIELDPAYSDQAHYFRGLAHFYQEKFDDAVDDFTVAIRMNPDFVAFYQRGKANLKMGEYRRALQDFDIALRLNEEFYEANLYRGINYYHLGMYEQSRTDLNLALQYLPGNAEGIRYLGLANQAPGNSNSAGIAQPVATGPVVRFDNPAALNNQTAVAEPAASTANASSATSIHRPASTPVYLNAGNDPQPGPAQASTDINFTELFKMTKTEPAETNQTSLAQVAALQSTLATDVRITNTSLDINQLETGLYNIKLEKVKVNGLGIQVASYSGTNNLMNLMEAYTIRYSKPVFVHASTVNGRKIYKVIIGQFSSRTEAEQFRNELKNGDFPDCFLVVLENY
jgi:tetratricopeptide (TPR) repeat protein